MQRKLLRILFEAESFAKKVFGTTQEHGGGSKKVALSEKDYPTRRVRSIGMLQGLISKISAPELQSQSQQYAGAHGGFVHRIEDPVLVGSEAEKEPGFWED